MKICTKENFKQLSDAISRVEKYLGTVTSSDENTITWKLNSIYDRLSLIESKKAFKYKSDIPKLNHIIEHNLNTFFVYVNVLAERENYWENVLCHIKYLDANKIEIALTEEQNLIVSVHEA